MKMFISWSSFFFVLIAYVFFCAPTDNAGALILAGAILGAVPPLCIWMFLPGKSDCKDDHQTINIGL